VSWKTRDGLGALHLSLVLAMGVLLANIGLRPLAYRIHPALPDASPIETTYELNMICRASDEAHIRTLLLTTISQSTVGLQSIRSEDIDGSDRTTVRAEVITSGPKHDTVDPASGIISSSSELVSDSPKPWDSMPS
jgi:putative Mg2+ transporter-C (MgtC) family protein